jgi:hypothetical protein
MGSDEPTSTGNDAPTANYRLRIERGTGASLVDAPLLEAAGRALTEAQANLNHARLKGLDRLTLEQVAGLSRDLASEALAASELPGEAPIEPLHPESSGWTGSDPDSEKIPWLILAADVLDCAALLMGTTDSLVMEVQQ